MSWRKATINDLGRVVTGKTPARARPDYFGAEYPFVTPSDLGFMHYYCTDVAERVSELGFEKHRNHAVHRGAAMCVCIGSTIGKCAIAQEPCLTNQQINSIIANENHDPKFIYYLLCNMRERIRAVGLSGGAAQPIINKSKFSALEVRVPDLGTQKAIAKTLSAYDDLIDNNRRRVALLEEAARLRYREWFVDFRFPGHEHVKIVDGLPDGWDRLPASRAFRVNPRTIRNDEGSITYIPMTALSEVGMTIDRKPMEVRRRATGVRFRNGDTLLARITPCLENGKTGYVRCLGDGEVACGSTEFIVLRGSYVSEYFVYLTARRSDFRENAIRSMIGSSGRQRVQSSCFDRYNIAVPPRVLATLFDEAVGDLFEQVATLDRENQTLADARDLLLPRLMNGDIGV